MSALARREGEAPDEFGRPRHHFRVTSSTNDRARELALAGAPSGTLVTADEQSAGRGRWGRQWDAPAGSALLCSILLRPLDERHVLLPLSVPLAVCEAIEAQTPVRCAVKWPNDVWIEEKKVAGILIEARPPEWAVIGVGVNVSFDPADLPDDLRWPATSIGSEASVEGCLRALLDSLAGWVAAPDDRILPEYRGRDALRGRVITWKGGEGTAEGVDERGNLIVRLPDGGSESLGAGEVQLSVAGS